MSSRPDLDKVRARIRAVILDEYIPSIAVAVAHRGEIVWEEGFGWANIEERVPATANTLYSLASISKPITATALMILVERGAIHLDRPMNDYLGSQKLTAHIGSASEATVRRVANHSSGLPRHYRFFYEDESIALPTMDQTILRYGVLVRPPGESYDYSNLGYGLLEYAIERLSGKSFAAFLRDEIFTPLDLTEGAVNRFPDFGNRLATRYRGTTAVPFYDFDHRGGSAVFMSAHDLVRFGIFHLHGALAGQHRAPLGLDSLRSMQVGAIATSGSNPPDKQRHGIGWAIGESHGMARFGHTGGMAGVSTRLSLWPQADLVVTILANGEGDGVHALEAEIVHCFLPETIRVDHHFRPSAALVGEWRGAVKTLTGSVSIELDFRANGAIFARVGTSPSHEVSDVALDERSAVLTLGGILGEMPTPDTVRYPYELQFSLKLRSPDVLNGSITAISHPLPDRWGNALSHWVELRKITDDQNHGQQ